MVLSSEIEQLKQQQQHELLKSVNLTTSHDNNHNHNQNRFNSSENPKPTVLVHRNIENLKLEEGVAISPQDKEESAQSRRGSTNSETAHIIEEIIEGIALKGRRGTLVRTISAVLR